MQQSLYRLYVVCATRTHCDRTQKDIKQAYRSIAVVARAYQNNTLQIEHIIGPRSNSSVNGYGYRGRLLRSSHPTERWQ